MIVKKGELYNLHSAFKLLMFDEAIETSLAFKVDKFFSTCILGTFGFLVSFIVVSYVVLAKEMLTIESDSCGSSCIFGTVNLAWASGWLFVWLAMHWKGDPGKDWRIFRHSRTLMVYWVFFKLVIWCTVVCALLTHLICISTLSMAM